MAYNRYDSDKQASYMDGIPVKISEQYKPPKKINVPGAILNKLSAETVLPEYDFSLERSMVDKMRQWRSLRSSQREARQHRLDAIARARAANESPVSTEEKSPPPESAVSPPASEPYSILTPVPINASTYTKSNSYSRNFNISEFEQDTSSPFDNMELKTINDLEELAHVLQPTVLSDNDGNTDVKKSPSPRINGYNAQYSFNGSSNWAGSYRQYPGAANTDWYREYKPGFPQHPTIESYVVQRLDECSKNVPDIVQQLELELRDHRRAETLRRRDEPLRLAGAGVLSQSSKQASSSAVSQTSLSATSALPNPYSQLSTTCQRLTQRLAEMGFPMARAARAAEMFGDDEARIIEFLVQVQRLEELNFPGDRAERALVANNYKETETVEYLNIVSQLMDLGFGEDKVEKALEECGSDRDKALDQLIS